MSKPDPTHPKFTGDDELDTAGHVRAAFGLPNDEAAATEDDDTEGHKKSPALTSDGDDDVEGHRKLTL